MMALSSLVERLEAATGSAPAVLTDGSRPDTIIDSVCHDSRSVSAGALFVCLRGAAVDGHDHARAAVDRGAVAVMVDHQLPDVGPVPQILVDDTRVSMATAANAVFGDPSERLSVVGVTGTNGKTTVTHLLAAIVSHAGTPCGVIGTLSGARTTPESPELQRELRALVDSGAQVAAIEVSSHALSQHRVDGTRFAVGVFTNLTPDHLDYHGDLESYFAAKASLFAPGRVTNAVIDVDGPWGARLADMVRADGLDACVEVSITDAAALAMTITGSEFRWRGQRVSLPLPGRFNVSNALAAAEAALCLGLSASEVAKGLAGAEPIPGRFEIIVPAPGASGLPVVIVDYAHTPDGIEQVLRSVREIEPESTICVVFGCGGDRDRKKRPLMGAAARSGADHLVVTSDNPRSEDPAAIIEEILVGVGDDAHCDVVLDRADAIARAIDAHGPGDVVVIAGKGHETTQTIGDRVIPFDDRSVARTVMESIVHRPTGEATS